MQNVEQGGSFCKADSGLLHKTCYFGMNIGSSNVKIYFHMTFTS